MCKPCTTAVLVVELQLADWETNDDIGKVLV